MVCLSVVWSPAGLSYTSLERLLCCTKVSFSTSLSPPPPSLSLPLFSSPSISITPPLPPCSSLSLSSLTLTLLLPLSTLFFVSPVKEPGFLLSVPRVLGRWQQNAGNIRRGRGSDITALTFRTRRYHLALPGGELPHTRAHAHICAQTHTHTHYSRKHEQTYFKARKYALSMAAHPHTYTHTNTHMHRNTPQL